MRYRLQRMWELFRAAPAALLLAVALPDLAGYLALGSWASPSTPDEPVRFVLEIVAAYYAGIVLDAFAFATASAALSGEGLGVAGAITAGFRNWLRILLPMLLAATLVAGGFVLLFVPGVVLLLNFAFTPFVAYFDRQRFLSEILARSSDLTEGVRLPIFGWLALVYLLSMALTLPVFAANPAWLELPPVEIALVALGLPFRIAMLLLLFSFYQEQHYRWVRTHGPETAPETPQEQALP